jgi:hypothetical protein
MQDYSFIDQKALGEAIKDLQIKEQKQKDDLKRTRAELKVLKSFVKEENKNAV